MTRTLSTRRLPPPKEPAEKDADSVPKPAIPNPKPSTKKRRLPLPTTSQPAKRLKPTSTPLNTPPTTKLHIYVFGDGESGELGLGPTPINGNKPTSVTRPRLNPLLPASTVGVVQIAAGGMHCITLTHDQNILTWGVNEDGALGRDTTWEAPTRDMDLASNSDDSSSDGDLNPKECTPTAIPREAFGNVSGDFVQVVALDSASFALTSTGAVYGWGTFRASHLANDGILGFTTASSFLSSQTHNPSLLLQRTPIPIPSLTNIISLAAGNNHILSLSTTGRFFSWGTPEQSQLGRRLPRSRFTALTPAPVALPPVTKIACGAYHSFAITTDGVVPASLPPPAENPSAAIIPVPTPVTALSAHSIRNIAGGEHHSLACTPSGSLLTWDRCDDSQSGIPFPSQIPVSSKTPTIALQNLTLDERRRPRSLAPTVVSDFVGEHGGGVVGVAAGIDNSFAVTSQGAVYAWGFSANYRTGLGREDTLVRPTS
ncbi:hypothetical protein VE02_07737 [Pseudogymnoascus sp. 03VT05]|nr:hypothetical protein VE02_07737 [Pseudogymnoascus sp. 03VT05]